jgi:membrane protease YdiL (CAAX protease family)
MIARLGILLAAIALVTDISTPIVVAFVEECVFRLAFLGALLLWTSVPWAIAISTAAFAGAHVANQHVTVLALCGYIVGGIYYGMAFVKTGRLWLPFGLHLGWNYGEGRLLGFSVSGGPVPGPFVLQHDSGPALLTGSDYGLEGGLVGLAARFILLALLLAWLYRKHEMIGNIRKISS